MTEKSRDRFVTSKSYIVKHFPFNAVDKPSTRDILLHNNNNSHIVKASLKPAVKKAASVFFSSTAPLFIIFVSADTDDSCFATNQIFLIECCIKDSSLFISHLFKPETFSTSFSGHYCPWSWCCTKIRQSILDICGFFIINKAQTHYRL